MKYLTAILFFGLVSAANAQEWQTVETFRGSGIKNTATFTVNSNTWRVVYKSESTSGFGKAGHIFQLYLLEPGDKLFESKIIANQANKVTIKGQSYVYESGTFYFKTNSANGDWIVKVQVRE